MSGHRAAGLQPPTGLPPARDRAACEAAGTVCRRHYQRPHARSWGGSVADWSGQAQKCLEFKSQSRKLSGNSLRQTVHTHRASVNQAAKLVAALLKVAGVTAGLAESNGSLPPGL